MPVVTFLVLPIFALANAGVSLSSGLAEAVSHSVCLGVILGLFGGKQLGIWGGAWLAVRLGVADLPRGVRMRQIHGVAVLGGIGFTMSLFVNGLAFSDDGLQDIAKVGILVASALSALTGLTLLTLGSARQQVSGEAEAR
jgi:NhaA family Na+:H+ antiporter